MIVDSHCHLDFPELASNIDPILARAKDAGIEVMQTICTRLSKFDQVLAIAEKYENVYASIGIHPHNTEEEGEFSVEDIVSKCSHPKVIGIGETGLDFYYDHSDRKIQEEAFRKHIAAARITGLPIIIHTRAADEKTIEIITDEMQKGRFKGLIHCFSTSKELALASIELGLYISISGIITFKKADELRGIVQTLPIDRLLVETDSPFLAPVPHRGKTNEPAFTKEVAIFLADMFKLNYEEFARTTTKNFYDLFSKVVKS